MQVKQILSLLSQPRTYLTLLNFPSLVSSSIFGAELTLSQRLQKAVLLFHGSLIEKQEV